MDNLKKNDSNGLYCTVLPFEREGMFTDGISRKEIWYLKYNILKEFFIRFEQMPNATTEYKGIKIGRWRVVQHRNYERNRLTAEQIKALEEIDQWYWSPKVIAWGESCKEYAYCMKQMVEDNKSIPLEVKKTILDEIQNVLTWLETDHSIEEYSKY